MNFIFQVSQQIDINSHHSHHKYILLFIFKGFDLGASKNLFGFFSEYNLLKGGNIIGLFKLFLLSK